MDAETKTLLLVLAAVAAGAVAGWCIRQELRKKSGSPMMARKAPAASADDGVASIPVDTVNAGGPCGGCRS